MTLLYNFIFYFFGLVAVASAAVFVTRKSPVAAALWLVNVLFCLSALYVMLDAQFIGVIQIIVYAGAIMVVFLFVIMLLNLGEPGELIDTSGVGPWLAAGGLAVAVLAAVMARVPHTPPVPSLTIPPDSLARVGRASGAVMPTRSASVKAACMAVRHKPITGMPTARRPPSTPGSKVLLEMTAS